MVPGRAERSKRYASLKEVAARAGVSFQTASKVLNGGSVRVSAQTADRILAAARELGYSPNTVARSLVRRSTRTLGTDGKQNSPPHAFPHLRPTRGRGHRRGQRPAAGEYHWGLSLGVRGSVRR